MLLPTELDDHVYAAQERRREGLQQYVNRYADKPQLAQQLANWANVAPTLPRNVLFAFASANVAPDSDLGQWAIRNGTIALRSRPRRKRQSGLTNQPPNQASDVLGLLGDRGRVGRIAGFSPEAQREALDTSVTKLAGYEPDQLALLGQGKDPTPEPGGYGFNPLSSARRLAHDVGDVATTGTRYSMGALQAPYEGTQAAVRGATAGIVGAAVNPRAISGVTSQPGRLQSAVGSAPIQVGAFQFDPNANVADPKQITLWNMIQGADSGSGPFPAGEAMKQQQEAARRVASIRLPNGELSALTPGRGLAALVTEPGTVPYNVASGAVDFLVALKADPANLALTGVGNVRRARRVLSPDAGGAITGWTRIAHGPTWTQLADGNPEMFEDLARNPSFRSIRNKTKKRWPVQLTAAIADTSDPNEVRRLMDEAVGAAQITDVPKVQSYSWKVPLRSASQLPRGYMDVDDLDNAVEQAERMLASVKVPRNEWDPILSSVAKVQSRNDLMAVAKERIAPAIENRLVDEYGAPRRLAKKLTRYFHEDWDEQAEFFIDEMGNVPHVPGALIDDVPVEMVGPHLPSEGLNRVIPVLDGRLLRREARKWRNVWNNPAIQVPVYFADYFNDSVFKVGALFRGAWTVRVVGEEQSRMGAVGLTSMFRDPVSHIGYVVGTSVSDSRTARFVKKLTGPIDERIGRAGQDFTGAEWVDQAGEFQSRYGQVLSRGRGKVGDAPGRSLNPDRIYTKNRVQFKRGSSEHPNAWAGELDQLATDPVGREVARAMRGERVEAIPDPIRRYFRGDVLTAEGRALAKNGDLTIAQLEDLFDEYAAARITGAIRQADLEDPTSAGAVFRDLDRSDAARMETPDILRAEADVLRERLNQRFIELGAAPAREAADPVDALKEWFSNGAGRKWRDDVIDMGGWRANLTDRVWADKYIDSVVDRIHIKTGRDADLLAAVADGTPFRVSGVDKSFLRKLEDLAERGVGPEKVKGRAFVVTDKQQGLYNRAVNRMFQALMSTPTNKLSRSPAFRQFYWNYSETLMPHLDPETQQRILRVARNTRIGDDLIKRMERAATVSGDVGLEQADVLAKAHALEKTRDLLYDASERGHFFDAHRIAFPFGEAWKEVLTRWARIVPENPQTIRRAQQGYQEAKSEGFFYTDPEDGKLYFNFPASDWLTKRITSLPFVGPLGILGEGNLYAPPGEGAPFGMRAPVQGINIVGQGTPGVGPLVQVLASDLVPKEQKWDWVRDFISPYGDPDLDGGILEAWFPGWADKARTSGWLGPLGGSADQERIYENSFKDTFTYLASKRQFSDIDSPEELQKLGKEAQTLGKKVWGWRSLYSFFAPASPEVRPEVKGKDGRLYELRVVAADYGRMLDANDGDWVQATIDFIDTYGATTYFALEPRGRRETYGAPTTRQAELWREEHKDFADAYGDVYGFFAPQGGDFDYDAYKRSLARGDIKPSDFDEWLAMANDRVASAIYSDQQRKSGPNPNDAQRGELGKWRSYLMDHYPGYDPYSPPGNRSSRQKMINDLQGAVTHGDVSGTPLAATIRSYLEQRKKASDRLPEFGVSKLDGNKAAAPLRTALREWGDFLVQENPQFAAVWDYVFSGEVELTDEELEAG